MGRAGTLPAQNRVTRGGTVSADNLLKTMKDLFERHVKKFAHIHLTHENLAGRVIAPNLNYVQIKEQSGDMLFVSYDHIAYVRFKEPPQVEVEKS